MHGTNIMRVHADADAGMGKGKGKAAGRKRKQPDGAHTIEPVPELTDAVEPLDVVEPAAGAVEAIGGIRKLGARHISEGGRKEVKVYFEDPGRPAVWIPQEELPANWIESLNS